jgi:hypothetical protein
MPRAQTEHFPAIKWMVLSAARMSPLEFAGRFLQIRTPALEDPEAV